MANPDSTWGLHNHVLKHPLPSVLQYNRTNRSVHSDYKARKKMHASERAINKGLWELKGSGEL